MFLGQYFSHQCKSGHCAPYPICEGNQDGVHPQCYKTDSPWFMACKDERFVSDGLCPSDPYLRVASKIMGGVYECVQYTQRPGRKYAGLRRHVGRKLYPGRRRV